MVAPLYVVPQTDKTSGHGIWLWWSGYVAMVMIVGWGSYLGVTQFGICANQGCPIDDVASFKGVCSCCSLLSIWCFFCFMDSVTAV